MILTREPRYPEPPRSQWQALMRSTAEGFSCMGRMFFLTAEGLASFPRLICRPQARRDFVTQLYSMGISSLPVLTVVALFTGMILSLQIGIAFKQFNQELMVASSLMYTMLREMGPFMSGLILAACVGSSMAAQLGAMTINEEITALEMMSINPIRFLVTPRIWAMFLMMPLLSFYTCIIAVLGGALIGATQLNISFMQFMEEAMLAAEFKDLYVGLFKAALFGILICGISCSIGFNTKQGAAGVGASTRQSVVVSFLFVLIVGYFVTRFFYVF